MKRTGESDADGDTLSGTDAGQPLLMNTKIRVTFWISIIPLQDRFIMGKPESRTGIVGDKPVIHLTINFEDVNTARYSMCTHNACIYKCSRYRAIFFVN